MTVMTLVQMVDPMKYCGMVIPLLPQTNPDYMDLLGAPTPYIIGTLPNDNLKVDFLNTTIVLNLDKRTIQIDEDLPPYPNYKVVTESIKKILDKSKKEYTKYSIPEEYMSSLKHKYSLSNAANDEVMKALKQPFELIFSDYIFSFFITDLDKDGLSTTFNKDLFLECTPKEPFFAQLINSQSFDLWINSKIVEYLKLKGEDNKQKAPVQETKKPMRKRSLSIRKVSK